MLDAEKSSRTPSCIEPKPPSTRSPGGTERGRTVARRRVTCTWREASLRPRVRTPLFHPHDDVYIEPERNGISCRRCRIWAGQRCARRELVGSRTTTGFQPVERPSRWIRLERERRAGLGTRKRNVFARSDSPFIRLHAARTALDFSPPLSSSPNPLSPPCVLLFREAAQSPSLEILVPRRAIGAFVCPTSGPT